MKFVDGRDQAAVLLALSYDKNHKKDTDVRTTTSDGYLVHDDVYTAWAAGQKGTLDVATSQQAGTLKVTFTATPAVPVTYTFPGGVTVTAPTGVAVNTFASAGTYSVTAASSGRTTKVWNVVVAAAATSRQKKSDREARDGD